MKFLIDAHLPRKLCALLQELGCEAYHTMDLPTGNASTDLEITLFADTNNLVIMTKDSDFVDAHLLVQRPKKLLHISVGNISNQNLLKLVQHNYEAIFRALTEFDFVELSATSLIVHELPE